jgi:hypothetical protein
MRAGIRVATAAALWGFAFVACAQLHITPERSVAPVIGAALWLVACVALVPTRPGAKARRLVVATAVGAAVLLAGSAAEVLVDRTLVPEFVAAVGFLATLQCFAATMTELAFDAHDDEREHIWSRAERVLAVVDVASAVVAVAWATNVVERRPRGRFRVTDLDLAPASALGRVVLAVYAVVLAVAATDVVLATVHTWRWAAQRDTAPDAAP